MNKNLILASQSPRRREILDIAGYKYTVIPSNADEMQSCESPSLLARENAFAKAKEVYNRLQDENCVVLGSDTIVAIDNEILGKPKNQEDAFNMLKRLSGRVHHVISGFAIVGKNYEEKGDCCSEVKFKTLSDSDIRAYIATGEPMDKAGAYGIQEKASLFVEYIKGDFFNIVGLPISSIETYLEKSGILPAWK